MVASYRLVPFSPLPSSLEGREEKDRVCLSWTRGPPLYLIWARDFFSSRLEKLQRELPPLSQEEVSRPYSYYSKKGNISDYEIPLEDLGESLNCG